MATAMTKSLPQKALVLYADDDADDRLFVKEAFNEFSSIIELETFEHGEELLRYIKTLDPIQPQPCLIILDVNMPVLDGKQTLRKLRELEECKTVPTVLFTTSTLPSEIAFAKAYDAGFITKPLHAQQIHLIVDQFIEHCTDEMKDELKKHRSK